MTIDTDGNIWVAVFGASSVLKIDPMKPETLLETITLPSKQVCLRSINWLYDMSSYIFFQPTSVAFGGENLDELYVTSANFKFNNVELSPPIDGGTYRITGLNVKGYPGVSAIL